MKLIKAVGLIDDLAAAVARDELSGLSYSVVKRYIMRQDAVDAVEVVHGRWMKHRNETKCSICKFIYYSNHDNFNYCPNCGAKMDGERKGKNHDY